MKVPFSPPYIDDDVKKEVAEVLNSGWITTGPKTRQLEELVAGFCNVDAALAVNSATSALMLVLHWLGVKRGDEVIVPAYTYCATALAVMHVGAKPVMVDVGDDFTISPAAVARAITPNTKAVIAVDLGGWPCDYEAIYQVIESSSAKALFNAGSPVQQQLGRILLLADAAHSIGAVYHNQPAGELADITVFSFHAVKNLTTAEGGMICCNMPSPFDNRLLYQTLKLWSLNGQTKDAYTKTLGTSWRYDIVYPGFKMNMPDVLAAIGLAQFKKYGALLKERKRVFDFYTAVFSGYGWAICPPFDAPGRNSSYHLFPLQVKSATEQQRDDIIDLILKEGISVNVHFVPMPMLTIFKENYNIQDYPVSYRLYSREISLPVYPQLTNEQARAVTDAVIKAVEAVLHV
ncbi:DegT/DnrJ/EryC1/StrS family aminotransferase [Foetidibacter luteolus]|uniref:DegT/DnrJ/EryC1/StrS family aminotransferase n=1 Tax=Foetidibacter luteolus TaxID=2608880 RepID=UPI00129AED9A|nr:DegT/DnrJ/EryC1/StrS family aminotransferase [Foetidibacter luteolus]